MVRLCSSNPTIPWNTKSCLQGGDNIYTTEIFLYLHNLMVMFSPPKVPRKEKIYIKKNYFIIFGFIIKNSKESQI